MPHRANSNLVSIINADNQLIQWGDASGTNPAQPRVTQTYDANGHLLTKTVSPEDRNQAATTSQRYTYNIAERLIQVADSNQAEIARYSYDPFGRRIRKTVSQTNSQSSGQGTSLGITTYLYADEGLLAEADMSGNITTTYGWIPNGIWGTAPQWKADVTMGSGSSSGNTTAATLTYHYFHNDHLGTSQRLTNDQGVLTWSARMEAFGKTTTIDSIITNLVNGQSQTALMPTTTVNNLRFPGQIEDGETGTVYNYFRDYQASTGRYAESDPIGLNGGLNTYPYIINPLKNKDPLGLVKWTGTYFSFSPGTAKGLTVDTYVLTSECITGRLARVRVRGAGFGVGVGASAYGGFAEFEDKFSFVNPEVFNGPYYKFGIGVSAPLGYGYSRVQLGGATSSGGGIEAGFDASAGVTLGDSSITYEAFDNCGIKK